jgi:hypothetical protein
MEVLWWLTRPFGGKAAGLSRSSVLALAFVAEVPSSQAMRVCRTKVCLLLRLL